MIFKDEDILFEKEYKSSKTKYFAKYIVYSDIPILFSFFGNFGELEDIMNSFKTRDEVVEKSGLTNFNYVEIRDYSGSPDTNRDGRLYIKNYLNNAAPNLKGMLFVGTNLLLSIMIKTGMRTMKNRMVINIAKNVDDALKSAYLILNTFDDNKKNSLYELNKRLKVIEVSDENVRSRSSFLDKVIIKFNKLNPFLKAENFLFEKDFLDLNRAILRLTWYKNSTIEDYVPKTKNKKLKEIYETLIILNNDVNKSIDKLNKNIEDLKEETRKRAIVEEELKSKNVELNRSYENLKKSQNIIYEQEKLASLGTLSAGIAHEINNPAHAIKFTIEGLKLNIKDISYFVNEIKQLEEIKDETEKRDYLKKISELYDYLEIDTAIEEMGNVCQSNIKSISRIESIIQSTKRMAYKTTDYGFTNIHTVIDDAVLLCKNDLKQDTIITKDFIDKVPLFSGISQELIQVFINLITNSSYELKQKKLKVTDFIPEIKVSTLYCEDRNTIKVEFIDNGRGISDDIAKKIFDPFFTTKPLGEGTGLGMSLVYRVLEHHKGKIEVDTTFKEGAKFNIYIPTDKKIIINDDEDVDNYNDNE